MGGYSPSILDEAKRRGMAPHAVCLEKQKKREEIMAQSRNTPPSDPATFSERLVAASLGTVGLLYGIFLVADLLLGWGLGFTVLWLMLGALALAGAITAIAALWRWVYKGSGRFQMSDS